ncbi:MAG TPA: phosphonoacetaldehyde hydrolase [Candidatus Angelobacter sp.]|nr:phosphonoacetaldehyde hydrolase [Candidatus Angelobacter sp.]
MKRLEAVIFDWAGTTVDWGSLAPVRALTQLFANHGIQLSESDVRKDLGLFKKDHIRKILALEQVDAEWQRQRGKPASEQDVEAIFLNFMPMQMAILDEYAVLIDGMAGLAKELRKRGLKLGGTTGYTRPMLDLLLARAEAQDYRPDQSLCPDDVGGGRPFPWMCLRLALNFQLSSTASAVKVGDTVSDIQEGLNAGMWSVGVTATGNEVGLGKSQLTALSHEERNRRMNQARETLLSAGAHYVIDSVTHLEPVLEQIQQRLAAGDRP